MEKYTKKASAKVYKEVLKLDKKAPKSITYDQSFVLLMENWNMELGVEKQLNKPTKCFLYRDDQIPFEWEFDNNVVWKDGDWDWNIIYKTTLEDIISKKLYKRPKTTKRNQKKEKAK